MKIRKILLAFLIMSLLFVSCNKDDKGTASTKKEEKVTTSKEEMSKASETTSAIETSKEKKDDSSSAGKKGDEMSLAEIFDYVLKDIDELPMVENIEIEPELFESFLFIKNIDGAEALASEGMISSVAHSAVLLRLPEGADVEKVRSEIEKNADPTKWVCVSAEKTAVVSKGNTILLVMSFEDITDHMVEKFEELW